MAIGTLYDRMKAKALVAKASKLGEDVTYKPSGGTPRTIRAIARRDDPDEYGNSITQRTRWRVDNDSTTGITPAELDMGVDILSVPLEPGDEPTDRQIKRIVQQNNVRLILEVM